MTFKKTAGEFVFNVGKTIAQKLSGQGKTTGKEVIKNVKIAPNIDTKKAIEQKVVKTVDKAFKDANVPPSLRNQQKKSLLKRDEGKKLKSISYKLDELEEKVKKRNEGSKKLFKAFKGRKFNKGGRVGLKRGTNLGMQSVKYGLDNNPKITAADPKAKFIAANKKKKSGKRMKAAFGGGADMGKVASDKTKAEVKKYEKRAKDASKFLKNKDRSFGSMMREKYMR